MWAACAPKLQSSSRGAMESPLEIQPAKLTGDTLDGILGTRPATPLDAASDVTLGLGPVRLRRSSLSPCLRPLSPERLRPQTAALANGQCIPRPRTCFPEVRQRRIGQRAARQVEAANAVVQRLGLQPSPRVLGVDVNALEIAFDRGILSTVEASYQQDMEHVRSGCKAIHSLPRDHLDWERQQAQMQEACRTKSRLWSLEERYNNKMWQLGGQEATRLRRARRSDRESVGAEDERSAQAAEAEHLRHCHPMLAISQDYWLYASKVHTSREVHKARAPCHLDIELREVKTATPVHPCGPRVCFPLHSEPPRMNCFR